MEVGDIVRFRKSYTSCVTGVGFSQSERISIKKYFDGNHKIKAITETGKVLLFARGISQIYGLGGSFLIHPKFIFLVHKDKTPCNCKWRHCPNRKKRSREKVSA